jgi:hypothetical protein
LGEYSGNFYRVIEGYTKRTDRILDEAFVRFNPPRRAAIFFPSLSFPPCRQGRVSVKTSASESNVQRPKTFGAGLGWREAQRRGLGTAQVPKTEKRLNRFQSRRVIVP